MKNVIYRLESLSPFDLRGAAEHLSAMAAQGWRLERIERYFWRYRRAAPARVHYAVTCPPAAGEDGNLEDRLFFQELCAAAGWEPVTDWAELEIYASEREDPTPLETDQALLLERVHRSMRRTYLRECWRTFNCLAALLFSLIFLGALGRPSSFFLNSTDLLLAAVSPLFLLEQLWAVGIYYRWRRRSRRLVEEGEALAAVPGSYRFLKRLSRLLLLLLALVMVFLLFSPESSRDASLFALQVLLVFLILLPVYPIKVWLDRRGVPLRDRLLGIVLLFIAFALCLDYYGPLLPHRPSPPEVPSYTWDGQDWDAEPQSLPLTLEDLTGESWDHVRRRVCVKGRTPFAVETFYSEAAARENGERAGLQYSLLETSGDGICRAIWEDLLDRPDYRNHVPEDPAPWGAEAAWRQRWSDPSHEDVLLLWPGRIVTLRTEGLSLDRERMALAAARLGPENEKEDVR